MTSKDTPMHPVDLSPDLFDGAAELERTERGIRPHRLPRWVREQLPEPQLLAMEAQPSGVVIAFRTAATRIELVLHTTRAAYRGVERPRGRVDLRIDGEDVASDELTAGDASETDLATGRTTSLPGDPHTAVFDGLPSAMKDVQLWLPHNESVEVVALRADAPVAPATADRALWVHHGSSISQGSNAIGPTRIWPAVTAQRTGVRLRNLGFGGSALLDPAVARVIRDGPADVISLKVGINIVNLDSMRLRSLVPALHGFLDTIREGHPTTPLLLVSPLHCAIHERTPGPGSIDPASLGSGQVRFLATGTEGDTAFGRLTLEVIREAIAGVAAQLADPNLYHVDGLELYGAADEAELPLLDALHPGTEAHQRIGERFAEVLRRHVPA